MTDASIGRTSDRTEMNRKKADRRRETSRAVRDAREKLSSSSGTRPQFDYEILLGYARNRLSAFAAIVVLLTAVAATATYWVPIPFVAAWLAAALATHSLNGLTCRRFFGRTSPDNVKLSFWRRQFALTEAFNGVAFGLLFFLPAASPDQFGGFAFGALLTYLAVTGMVGSNMPSAVASGTLPVAVAGAASFAITQNYIGYTMAAFVTIAECFFLILASRLHESALTTLEHRAEKDALIAELERANAISDESRRRAEEANLAKSRFLATMSHELRTPLNAILGFSEIVKNEVFGPIGNAHYKEYVGDIHNSGTHLLNLINEILDLSRIEAGRYTLNEEAVMLAHVVEDCHHLIKLRAKTKGITIHEQFEANLPKLWADERAVRQIVLNLLSNAVKFTPSGGDVWLKMGWTAGGGQYVSVRDNGPGIPRRRFRSCSRPSGRDRSPSRRPNRHRPRTADRAGVDADARWHLRPQVEAARGNGGHRDFPADARDGGDARHRRHAGA